MPLEPTQILLMGHGGMSVRLEYLSV
jgi:hypothetical protein